MSLKETVDHLRQMLVDLIKDLDKSTRGNKAASQRVRTRTIKLEKVAKRYRKESIQAEKKEKSTTKKAPASRKAPAKKASSTKKRR